MNIESSDDLIKKAKHFLLLVHNYTDEGGNKWCNTIDSFFLDDNSLRFDIGLWPGPYIRVFNKFLKQAGLNRYLKTSWAAISRLDGTTIYYEIKPEFKEMFKNIKFYLPNII